MMRGMNVIQVLLSACLVISLIHLEVGVSANETDVGVAGDPEEKVQESRLNRYRYNRRRNKRKPKSLISFLRYHRYSEKNRDLYYDNDNNGNDAEAAADDGGGGDDTYDDQVGQAFKANSLCTEYLFSFLEGSTDAKDNCEGIQNAYVSAYCATDSNEKSRDDDHDDYFVSYNHISCCESLKSHYDAYCDESEIITNMHLLLIASVLLLCEMAKSLIKTHKIHWIPEAGGCIIVGTLTGFLAHITPLVDLDDLSFNEDLFLCILLPPIIFEAALSVNKKEFRRRRLAIMMFAVVGTILSTFMTGYIVHYGSYYFSDTQLPLLDSFIFGSLISSIDPVAILSVLTSLNLTETDTVFILVFGESLLNDGVAITLFNTLISHYARIDEGVSADEVLGAIADFVIVGFGSILIGILCGFAALIYFWFLRKKLNSSMEVGSFFLWAGIPYYICDEVNLSGIVAIVTIGFFMDIYIAKPKEETSTSDSITSQNTRSNRNVKLTPNDMLRLRQAANDHYVDLGDSNPCNTDTFCGVGGAMSPSGRSIYSLRSLKSLRTLNMRELILREERFRLTAEADKHVRFVAHLLSSLSENCIFVYLGLFLYSKKYTWDVALMCISIISCILSRAVMVIIVCTLVWYLNIMRQSLGCYKPNHLSPEELATNEPHVSRTAAALQLPKTQLVLVLAGLRGAVSLALVESVPMHNGVTGDGSLYKGQMKAMTSASIIFTIFVIGGSSYYVLRKLGLGTNNSEDIETSLTDDQRLSKWKEAPKPEEPLRKTHINTLPEVI